MKIEKLNDIHLNQHYHNFDSCIRCDIPSFFSRHRKYKTVILTKKIGRGAKYSFGCTCNTGLRSTPCAHGVLLIYLYANYFRDVGFLSISSLCDLPIKKTILSNNIVHHEKIQQSITLLVRPAYNEFSKVVNRLVD